MKITAVLLMLIIGVAFCISAFSIAYMNDDYNKYSTFKYSNIYSMAMNHYAFMAFNHHVYYENSMNNELNHMNLNCYYHITDDIGTILFKNYSNDEAEKLEGLTEYNANYYGVIYNEPGMGRNNISYDVTLFLKNEITSHNYIYFAQLLFNMRYWLIAIAIVSFILVVVLGLFLLFAAGHRKDTDEITLSSIDRVPLDLLAVICIGICAIFASVITYSPYINFEDIFIVLFFTVLYFTSVVFIMSVAVRIKTKTLLKNTLIYHMLKSAYHLLSLLPMIWKSAFWVIMFLFINFICVISEAYFFNVLLVFAAVVYVFYFLISLNKMKVGTKKIAAGDLDYKIDTSTMILDLREIGNDLNNISDGMQNAVNERMKSERMKSELITNVSHDIRTPLTSIINYVDLLRREDIDSETIREYIEILYRQSNKLKKLTDDLIDASKASTGNVSVNITELDIIELFDQSIGEYSEKFNAIGIEPITNMHGITTLTINSDGRLLWRVFDNLFNNIYKYAMPNTRVYIDISLINDNIAISIKNISRDSLNVSSDELMERFIRGDSSRTTEGSGLGLSISRSLTEILGGSLNLFIDGDLFKIVLILSTRDTVAF